MEECKKRRLFAFPIETGLVYGGVPDTCITGRSTIWIELKWVTRWPVRESTPVKRDLLRPAQKNWIDDYLSHGGQRAWVLVRVHDSYFLFPGLVANRLGEFTRADYEAEARWISTVRGADWSGFFRSIGDAYE